MHTYQHKYDPTRTVEAVQLTDSNAEELADTCGGVVHDNGVLEIPVEGSDETKFVNKGDYVVLDSESNFHVRNATVFEARYKLSDSQDEEFNYDDEPSTIGEANVWPPKGLLNSDASLAENE